MVVSPAVLLFVRRGTMQAANDNYPTGAAIRFIVEPRLIPTAKAARRLHLKEIEFEGKRTELHRHGFPLPCPVTGHFDLVAIGICTKER
jgi:hypothetical protein